MENKKILSEQEKQAWFARYNEGVHREGRIWTIVCLGFLLLIPFLMGMILGAMPDMNRFLRGFINVAIIYYPTSLVEYLIYVPMLGSGASYLSFITGNLSNLKIPCAINAREMAQARVGTPENEIISTLSVATSSLVTVVVLAVGVLLLVPLQGVLTNPMLTPAFDNVVPALFGALGFKYFLKGRKFAAIPLVLSSAVCILMPSMIRQTSVLLIIIGALTIGVSFVFYKKGALEE
ncbi:MAG: hypothetical protein E7321_00625 [Clostridiales bacterium]|nr:hypothetical protein [Clostridiales bacterium]